MAAYYPATCPIICHLSLALAAPAPFNLIVTLCPLSGQPLADQLFLNQSEVTVNNFYTTLGQETLHNANVQPVTRSLDTVVST